MTSPIPLPTRCLTLLPPWPQAIRKAGKRIENRSSGVAAQVGEYRGLVGLSQSKGYSTQYTKDDAWDAALETEFMLRHDEGFKSGGLGRHKEWEQTAGKLWLVAELVSVAHPHESWKSRWHVPGQWGLILGRVWEVKPVTCTGGQGLWTADKWCARCGHIYADSAKPALRCYSCKAIFPECLMQEAGRVHLNTHHGSDIPRLQLEIITEVR